MAIVLIIAQYTRTAVEVTCDSYIFIHTIILWFIVVSKYREMTTLARKHAINLTSNPDLWLDITSSFTTVRRFSDLINDSISSQITWYIAAALFDYPFDFAGMLCPEVGFSSIYANMLFLPAILMLYFAADVCRQTTKAFDDLVVIFQESRIPIDGTSGFFLTAMQNSVGVCGSKLFRITFYFLENVTKCGWSIWM